MTSLILVAHGSRDTSATRTVFELAQRVAQRRPGLRVRAAFLHHDVPHLDAALAKEAALLHDHATVVPLFLSNGHAPRVGIRGVVESVGQAGLPISVRIADVIGPVEQADLDLDGQRYLTSALLRRLAETGVDQSGLTIGRDGRQVGAIVLAAVGSRASRAMQAPFQVARWLAAAAGVVCRVAYVAGGTPLIGEVVRDFEARGASDVAVVSYLLAPGVMFERVTMAARRAGVMRVSAPLGDAPELAELVLLRSDAAH